MSYLEFLPGDEYPRPRVGSKAYLDPARVSPYTVVRVSPKGTRLTLRRDGDGFEVVARRKRIGPIPRELSRADVTPAYRTEFCPFVRLCWEED